MFVKAMDKTLDPPFLKVKAIRTQGNKILVNYRGASAHYALWKKFAWLASLFMKTAGC